MRILIINPNTTASMTDLVAAEARGAAAPGTEIVAVNPAEGPLAIQGVEDGAAALPHLIAMFDREMAAGTYDAVVIACFDDTGLWLLKERTSVPVVGIGEAGFHAAMLLGKRFTVITTLPVSVPVIEQNIVEQGITERCAEVRATSIPVLDLEADTAASLNRIAEEIEAGLTSAPCDTIILGCAGMANIVPPLKSRFGLPIIDGVKSAIGLCETLHRTRAV
jgi:allantoin racemase